MAAVDSLLKVMVVRNADLLVVASGETPSMRRGGVAAALSMPTLDAALVEAFVTDVLPDDALRAELVRAGTLEHPYVSVDGEHFSVLAETRSKGFRLSFRRGGAPKKKKIPVPPPRPKPVPVPVPVPVPEKPTATAEVHSIAARPIAAVAPPLPVHDPTAFASIFARAEYDDASDILFSSGCAIRARVGGQLVEIGDDLPTDHDIFALVAADLDADKRETFERTGSIDLAVTRHDGDRPVRYRVNLFRQHHGYAAAFRPVRTNVPTLIDLNLPESLTKFTDYPTGLVLVTGPAGSGKSTTLVALTEHLNRTRPKHIITLEDPIEYQYTPKRALIHQREIGTHVDGFPTGLRAALRESPDVIILGEMRDHATISAALTAAETGHLVLGTLHCSSAAVAIDRIVDVFPDNQQRQVRLQLAGCLRAVITQFLLPTRRPPERVPAFETLIVTAAVANQIRENKVHQIPSAIVTGKSEGMVPLDRTLAKLVKAGRISRETAKAACHDEDSLNAMINR
jgi:twitching motility protein PilT